MPPAGTQEAKHFGERQAALRGFNDRFRIFGVQALGQVVQQRWLHIVTQIIERRIGGR